MSDSFVTPWAVTCHAPLSMGFLRQEYLSGFLFPLPGDLSDLEIEPLSPALAGRSFTPEPSRKPFELTYSSPVSIVYFVKFQKESFI